MRHHRTVITKKIQNLEIKFGKITAETGIQQLPTSGHENRKKGK